MLKILKLLPLNYLSYLFGKFAEIKISWIAYLSKLVFTRLYKIDLSESELQLSEYKSLNKFFIRNLKLGARPLGKDPLVPVDGYLRNCGIIKNSTLVQIKGIEYSLAQLLPNTEYNTKFDGGSYFAFYLAPHNYHHIHSPVSGKIISTNYVPGSLFPVTNYSVESVPGIFAVNERVITYINSEFGLCAVVMVGATNVGKISLSYHDLVTNQNCGHKIQTFNHNDLPVKAGDRIGTFNLGSSVVLVFEKSGFEVRSDGELARNLPVKYGETLINCITN